MAGKRWQDRIRQRIERERDEAIGQLRDMGITLDHDGGPRKDVEHARDEGDQAQLSERQDINVMTRERLAERINRLTAALERLVEGTYGTCDVCGGDIERARLEALPEAVRCLKCQERSERAA